jgi:hypothetical protein
MFLNNIEIEITEVNGNKYKFVAKSNGIITNMGIVDTFTYNFMTKTFAAGRSKITGVCKIEGI